MNNQKTDQYYIGKIIENIENINSFINIKTYQEFVHDNLLISAIMFQLINLSENVKCLSESFKSRNTYIEWTKIYGFRNRIVHEYGNTDYHVVFEIIKNDLPKLLINLRQSE